MASKAKAKPPKKNAAPPAPKSSDIPLDHIPERTPPRREFTDDYKRAAAQRILKGESSGAVATELGIVPSVLLEWTRRLREGIPFTLPRGGARPPQSAKAKAAKEAPGGADLIASLRNGLESAHRARDERLEVAAFIVENDGIGKDAEGLAKAIRAMKRAPPP